MRTLPPPARPYTTSPAPVSIPATGRKLLEQFCACPLLPSVPTVVAEVLQATAHADEANLQQVSRIVAKDPAMVARVLRTVNSSYFGLRNRLGRVLLGAPKAELRDRTTTPVTSAAPAPLPLRDASEPCGMNDPGEVCC